MRLFYRRGTQFQLTYWITALLLATIALVGYNAVSFAKPAQMAGNAAKTPTPTVTRTPKPAAAKTPVATATPKPAAAAAAAPKVTIPKNYKVTKDDRLHYSFAVPRGWTALDLKGAQFRQMLEMAGQGSQVSAIDDFLETKEGKQLGKIYLSDLLNAMQGGIPSAIVVYVLEAPGYSAEAAKELVDGLIKANASMLGDVTIDSLEATTINNLPAVSAVATADLASVGMNNSVFVKVVGLVANDQIYIMLLATQGNLRKTKEPIFDAVIGTFRPE